MSDQNDNTVAQQAAEAAPAPAPAAAGGKKNKKSKSKAKAAAAAATASSVSVTDSAASDNGTESAAASSSSTTVATTSEATTAAAPITVAPTEDELRNVKSLVEQLKLNPSLLPLLRSAKTPEEALSKSFRFWNTQPVPKLDEKIAVNEHIEPNKPIAEIRQDPYNLPAQFKWDTLQLDDPLQLTELYTLLNENYVEDDEAMFRFDYQPDFLRWALQPPGWRADWHVGVRVEKSGLLVGFISAIPGQVRIYDKVERIVEINFLCVHKKLRAKRVAPVLISEITRRVNLTGVFQAVYTAGVVLPKPVSTCQYWHRSLNPKKLIEVKFSHLSRNMTMQRTIKLYRLPEAPRTPGFRAITERDMPAAHALLAGYLGAFHLTPVFDLDEFRHWMSPQNGIISAYVVECPKTKQLTDLVSYYTLPSSVMHHAVHKCVKAAYSFYNVSTKTAWTELMNDALIAARNDGFDVFNALDLMENQKFLKELKFGIGDGNLQYYLYNWRCPSMQAEQVGLILL